MMQLELQEAKEKIRLVNEAYETLGDVNKRKEYDIRNGPRNTNRVKTKVH